MPANDRATALSPWRCDDTVLQHRVRWMTLIGMLVGLAAAPGAALAQRDSGIWGASGGPVFAWGSSGFTPGWELSAMFESPLLHFALGGDYQRGKSRTGYAHYLAWEPGFVLGGSLGASLPDGGAGLYLGAWAGLAVPPNPHEVWSNDDGYSRLGSVVISFSIGFRYNGGESQFYLTPKVGYYEFPNPNS